MWLYAFLLFVHVFGGLRLAKSYSSDELPELSKNAFIDLLNLTDITCDGFEWCTIKKEKVAVYPHTSDFYYGGCCIRCSCEESCLTMMECCPDFKLKQHLNRSVCIYSEPTELDLCIDEIRGIENLDFRIYSEQTSSHNDAFPTQCISSDVTGPHINLAKRGVAYRMVSTCVDQNVSAETRARCELNDWGLSEPSSLDVYRPVQSLESGAVYRNTYCQQCGTEATARHEKWDVYLADIAVPIRIFEYPLSYDGLIHAALNQTFVELSKNIIFYPNNRLISSHPPTNCFNVDVISCLPESDANRNFACKWLPLHIHVWSDELERLIIYNNVACVFCNDIKVAGRYGVCSSNHLASKAFFLGRLRNGPLENVAKNVPRTDTVGQLDKVVSPSQCENGFIYDRELETCRKLYCPCGMVAHNLECTSVFEAITGKNVDFYVSITTPEAIFSTASETEYGSALVDYFLNQFKLEKLFVDNINVGKLLNKIQTQELAVYISLSKLTLSMIFRNVLHTISKVSRGMKIIKVGHEEWRVHMAIVDTISHVMGKFGKIKNIMTHASYRTIYSSYSNLTRISGVNHIQIGSCFFCYRVALRHDEIDGKATIVKLFKDSASVVPAKSVTSISIRGVRVMFVCVNLLLDHLSRSAASTRRHDERSYMPFYDDGVQNDETPWILLKKEETLLTAACVITVVLIAHRLIKRLLKQRVAIAERQADKVPDDNIDMSVFHPSSAEDQDNINSPDTQDDTQLN